MITVSKDYAGGNIVVREIADDTVYVSTDTRGHGEKWFYWNFELTSDRAGAARVVFDDSVVSRFGPATLTDHGWEYDKAAFMSHREFIARFSAAGTRRFAFSIPYQLADFDRFYSTLPQDRIRPLDFGTSERGRKIPAFAFGNAQGRKAVLTCRHHACESMAAFSLEGAVCRLLAETEYCAAYETIVVPFVDLDGVEDGEQGKSRLPHDHNRDYIDSPLYACTRRLKALADRGEVDALIDFHCPARWGGIHDRMSLIGLPTPTAERQDAFSEILARLSSGENGIEYRTADNVRFGTHWNTGAAMGTSCAGYFAAHGTELAFSFEHPYFGANDTPYSIGGLRAFGDRLARALVEYIRESGKL